MKCEFKTWISPNDDGIDFFCRNRSSMVAWWGWWWGHKKQKKKMYRHTHISPPGTSPQDIFTRKYKEQHIHNILEAAHGRQYVFPFFLLTHAKPKTAKIFWCTETFLKEKRIPSPPINLFLRMERHSFCVVPSYFFFFCSVYLRTFPRKEKMREVTKKWRKKKKIHKMHKQLKRRAVKNVLREREKERERESPTHDDKNCWYKINTQQNKFSKNYCS